MKKNFKIPKENIVRLLQYDVGCLATDRITVDGAEVGYMYREETSRGDDSGWRFFAGDETGGYTSDLSHTGVYSLNTIANYDPAILEYLDTPAPCAFEKIPGSRHFRRVEE